MHNIKKIAFSIFIYLLYSLKTFSQTYPDDTLVVRNFLDLNGLDTVSVEEASDSSNGRITQAWISNDELTNLIIPKEVEGLTHLKLFAVFKCSNLAELPNEIKYLIHVDTINFSENTIEFLPKEIGDFSNSQY